MRLFGRKLKQTKCLMASNYCGQIYVKTTVKSTFVSSSPHSSVRHIGPAHDAQRVQAYPVLRGAGDQDVCQGEGGDSSGAGQGGRGGQGCSEDHRPADLSAAVRAKHGTRPVDLSALWGRDGAVAHLAPDIRCDL